MASRSKTANAQHASLSGSKSSRSLLKSGNNQDLFYQGHRRTLQTVSELSQELPSPEPTSTAVPTATTSRTSKRSSVGHTLTGRKSRPQIGTFDSSIQRQPTILITEADTPSVQPASTAPSGQETDKPRREDGQVQSSDKSNRLSVRFSLKTSPQDDQGASSNEATTISESSRVKRRSGQNQASGKRSTIQMPVRVQDAMGRSVAFGDSVGAGRGTGKSRGGQAVTEAKGRRERQGRGISMGSSSTLPTVSPFPAQLPSSMQPRSRASQQQLLRNSRTMEGSRPPGQVHRQMSQPQIDKHIDSSDNNSQLLKRASVQNNGNITAYMDPVLRPRSTSSNIPTASRVLTGNKYMPFPDIQLPTGYPFPRPPPETHLRDRNSSAEYPPQCSRTRSSSTHSAVTANTSVSNGTSGSRKSSPAPRYRRSSNSHRQQNGVTKEHLDALAALTASTPTPEIRMAPDSAAVLQSQQRKLEEKTRRASAASEQAKRASRSQNRRSNPDTGALLGNRSNISSKNHKISVNELNGGGNGLGDEKMTPESVRLLREREKLLRWKAEGEKVEFEKREREKIRERVKRANEMEEARSKDLAKAQKRKRGCCGLFSA